MQPQENEPHAAQSELVHVTFCTVLPQSAQLASVHVIGVDVGEPTTPPEHPGLAQHCDEQRNPVVHVKVEPQEPPE